MTEIASEYFEFSAKKLTSNDLFPWFNVKFFFFPLRGKITNQGFANMNGCVER